MATGVTGDWVVKEHLWMTQTGKETTPKKLHEYNNEVRTRTNGVTKVNSESLICDALMLCSQSK